MIKTSSNIVRYTTSMAAHAKSATGTRVLAGPSVAIGVGRYGRAVPTDVGPVTELCQRGDGGWRIRYRLRHTRFANRSTAAEVHVMTWPWGHRYTLDNNPFINDVRDTLAAPDEAARKKVLNDFAAEWTRLALYAPAVIAHAGITKCCRLSMMAARRLWGALVLLLLPLEIISVFAVLPFGVMAIITAEAKMSAREARIAFRNVWWGEACQDSGA